MLSRMEHFRGRLMAGDQVILDPVDGQLKTQARPGSANGEWTGHFEFPPDRSESLVTGNRYRLVLIDGRSAFVYLRVADSDPLGRNIAHFHGTGSFRK